MHAFGGCLKIGLHVAILAAATTCIAQGRRLSAPIAGSAIASWSGIIRVSHGDFVDANCKRFYPIGWNSFRLIEAQENVTNALPKDLSVLDGMTYPDYLFSTAKAKGMNVGRIFGHSDVDYGQGLLLQPSPGVYNEAVWQAIDAVLDSAARHGMRMIIAFVDYWKQSDGVPQYVKWCAGGSLDAFWTDDQCRTLYKNHVRTFLTRKNTINGRLYLEDSTIFAWDLVNEPRSESGSYQNVQAWINEMAAFVKSIDSAHLLTIGEEGFYGPGDVHEGANPVGGWAEASGQDFTNNHRSKSLDYVGIHIWPDNWKDVSTEFATTWIESHLASAADLGKPLVMEEYGKIVSADTAEARTSERNPYFTAVGQALAASFQANGPAKGSLFWELTVRDQSEAIDVSMPDGEHPYGVSVWDETFMGPVLDQINALATRQGTLQPGCVPASAVAASLGTTGGK